MSASRFLNSGHLDLETLDLQSDYPRAAVAPHVAVERVARVYDQRTKPANAFVVSPAVVGDDHHAISCRVTPHRLTTLS